MYRRRQRQVKLTGQNQKAVFASTSGIELNMGTGGFASPAESDSSEGKQDVSWRPPSKAKSSPEVSLPKYFKQDLESATAATEVHLNIKQESDAAITREDRKTFKQTLDKPTARDDSVPFKQNLTLCQVLEMAQCCSSKPRPSTWLIGESS